MCFLCPSLFPHTSVQVFDEFQAVEVIEINTLFKNNICKLQVRVALKKYENGIENSNMPISSMVSVHHFVRTGTLWKKGNESLT